MIKLPRRSRKVICQPANGFLTPETRIKFLEKKKLSNVKIAYFFACVLLVTSRLDTEI